jgi:hypothetical protein
MNQYKSFVLEAKLNAAAGFGHPDTSASKPTRKVVPPTKEELARWRARSDSFREGYLKKHPNSKFKNVPTKGSIITRSKKVSSKPWAKAMAEHGVQALKDLGLQGKKIKYVAGAVAATALNKFVKAKDRKTFIEKAKTVFNNYRNKMKPEDRKELDEEAEHINNSDVPPSRTLLRKGAKGLFIGLVGLAAGAALFSGIVPADIAVFLGVKVLDTAFETVKHSVREPLSTLIAANTIHGFFHSKDSDDYAEDTLAKMKAKGHNPEESDEDAGDNLHDNESDETDKSESAKKPEEPKESDEEKLKRIVKERLGSTFDPSKYVLDKDGNLKRKG